MADKEVKVRVTADTGDFQSKMNGVSSTMNNTASSFQSFGSKIKGMFNSFSQGISTLSNIQTAVNTSSEAMKKQQLEAEKLKERIIGLNQNHVKLNASLKRTIAELNIATKTYGENSAEADELKVKLDMLKTQLNESRDEIKKYTEELKNMQKESDGINSLTDVTNKLKGAWQDFNAGNFESAFDKIASAGKGLFALMPGWTKATIALGTALKSLVDSGINTFKTTLADMKNTFAPIVNMVKGFGSQLISSFSSITQSDLSLNGFITTCVNYEDTMARVKGITQTAGPEFEKLANKTRELGATTRYSATEAGEAMIQLGQQGWDTNQILNATEHVLNLATVGNISLAESAELVSNGMNALGYGTNATTEEIQHFTDVVAQASVKSGTTVSQFAEAMTQVGSTAGALGITIDDLAVGIGLMGDRFIKSGKAGTSMKTFLANMSAPTKKMTECLSQYNLEGARQEILNGNLIEGYKIFAREMEGLTEEQKAYIATTLAGKEGMAGFLAIVNAGEEGIEELETAMKEADGVAEHMANTFDGSLKGALLSIKSGIEEQMLQIFDKLKPAIKGATETIIEFFRIWNKMSEKNKELKGLGDALGWLEKQSGNWSKSITKAIGDAINGINKFVNGGSLDSILKIGTNIIKGVCDGIIKNKDKIQTTMSDLIGKVSRWITENGDDIIEAGKTLLDCFIKGIEENQSDVNKAIDVICDAMAEYIDGNNKLDSVMSKFAENVAQLAVEKMKSAGKKWLRDIWNSLFSFGDLDDPNSGGLFATTNPIDLLFGDTLDKWQKNIEDWIDKHFGKFDIWGKIKKALFGNNTTSKSQDSGTKPDINKLFGNWHPIEDIKKWIDKTFGNVDIWGWIKKKIFNNKSGSKASDSGDTLDIKKIFGNWHPIEDLKKWIESTFGSFNLIEEIKKRITKGGTTSKGQDSGGKLFSFSDIFGDWNPIEDLGNWLDEKLSGFDLYGKIKEYFTKDKGEGEKVKVSDLMEIDTEKLGEIQSKLSELSGVAQNTASAVSTAFKGITDSARTSFVGLTNIVSNQFTNINTAVRNSMVNVSNIMRNQMVTCTNIVRNQMVNISNIMRNQAVTWSNIIRNQVQNARNALTTSFISMANVARTQMVNISNIVRNQAVNWSNIIRNQAQNARNALTSSFMSMVSVVRTQMNKCLSIVQSTMASIASATSRKLTINVGVNKTVTTSYKTVGDAPANLSMPMSAMSMAIPMSPVAMSRAGSSVGLGTVLGSAKTSSNNKPISIEVPLNVDGKEMARVTAKYMDGELKVIENRNGRKRGVK